MVSHTSPAINHERVLTQNFASGAALRKLQIALLSQPWKTRAGEAREVITEVDLTF